MQVALREFRTADFDRLWKIDQACFAPGIAYSRVELAFYMRRRGAFTLLAQAEAPAGEQIIGFITAESTRGKVGHVITIDVLPDSRRTGLGSRLLLAAEERLRFSGCSRVYLETAVDNLPAIAFYKRHGYDVIKTVPRYYSNGVDAFVMEKGI